MSRYCAECGQESRPGDQFCLQCGERIDTGSEAPRAAAVFRAPEDRRRRFGAFVVRRARVLMALGVVGVIAAIGAIGALSGSTDDSTEPRADDAAPTAAVTATAQRSTSDTDASGQSENSQSPAVTARGADGRTYRCSFGVTDRIDAARKKSSRRKRIARAQRRELARLDRQYPDRTAPADVVDRYNDLVARFRAQVKWTNAAVRAHNRLLVELCDAE